MFNGFCTDLSSRLQKDDCYKFLHMPWQLCCHGMCKILMQSDEQELNFCKMFCVIRFELWTKIASEMGRWIGAHPWELFRWRASPHVMNSQLLNRLNSLVPWNSDFHNKILFWNVTFWLIFTKSAVCSFGIEWKVNQHWFRKWLGALRHQAITWTSVDQYH